MPSFQGMQLCALMVGEALVVIDPAALSPRLVLRDTTATASG